MIGLFKLRLSSLEWIGFLIVIISPIAALTNHSFSFFIALLAVTIFLLTRVTSKNWHLRIDLMWPFLLLLWMGISVSWSFSPIDALKAFCLVCVYQVVLLIFSGSRSLEKSTGLVVATVIIFMIVLSLICFFVLSQIGTLRPTNVRNHWAGTISTRAAAESIVCLPILVYAYITRPALRYLTVFLIFFVMFIAVMTETRSGLVTTPLALLASILFISGSYKKTMTRLFVIIPIALITLGGVFVMAQLIGFESGAITRLLETDFSEYFVNNEGLSRDRTIDWGRQAMYSTGIELANDFSIAGVGYYSIGFYVEMTYGHFLQSHNVIITMLAELGLIGLLLSLLYVNKIYQNYMFIQRFNVKNSEIKLFSKALILSISFGLLIAQYKTMQANPILFLSIGCLFAVRYQIVRQKIEKL